MVTKKEMLMLQERTRQKILSEPKQIVYKKQMSLGERLEKSFSRHQMKTKKGVFEFGDIFMIAVFVLLMVVAMYIFQPFASILGTQMENQTNGSIVMTLIYLLPVVMVGFFIWGMSNKMREQRY